MPTTAASKVRKISVAAPLALFALSATAICCKQEHLRGTLADEAADVTDRINRRAYVALPDGRMALVHPKIDTDFTVSGVFWQLVDAVNPLP